MILSLGDGRHRPGRTPTYALAVRGLVGLGLVTAVHLLVPPPASGQGIRPGASVARVPAQTVQRVITAEFALCQRAENAAAGELDNIAAEIQQAINDAQRKVDKLTADSLALEQAVKNAKAEVDRLDAQRDPLIVERNRINDAQKPFEDQIRGLEQGANPGGGPTRVQQIESEMAGLRQEIEQRRQEIQAILKRREDERRLRQIGRGVWGQEWLEGRDDILRAEIAEREKQWTALRAELHDIRRQTIPLQFGAEYQRLLREEQENERKIAEVDGKLDPARKALEQARENVKNYDPKPLELAHEENLYLYEHFTRAHYCVEKRRQQLVQQGPPVETGFRGSASGTWSVFCRMSGADPSQNPFTEGGSFTVTFDGAGGVSGNYVGQLSNYAVTGRIAADGSAGGSGGGGGQSITWQGRFSSLQGGIAGNGGVSVTFSDFGGGTCNGSWSVP